MRPRCAIVAGTLRKRAQPSANPTRRRLDCRPRRRPVYFTPRGRVDEALPEAGAFAALPFFAAAAFAFAAVAAGLWPSCALALVFLEAVPFADCAALTAFFAAA